MRRRALFSVTDFRGLSEIMIDGFIVALHFPHVVLHHTSVKAFISSVSKLASQAEDAAASTYSAALLPQHFLSPSLRSISQSEPRAVMRLYWQLHYSNAWLSSRGQSGCLLFARETPNQAVFVFNQQQACFFLSSFHLSIKRSWPLWCVGFINHQAEYNCKWKRRLCGCLCVRVLPSQCTINASLNAPSSPLPPCDLLLIYAWRVCGCMRALDAVF